MRLSIGLLIAVCLTKGVRAQKAFTWQEIRDKFEATNPTLRASQLGVDEAKAQETTAWLRPNPDLTTTLDQLDPFTPNPYRPLANTLPLISASYLHERQHKRELRLESAQKGTAIAVSQQADLERTLLFSLRSAFVQTLQAKAVLALTRDNLAYYDGLLVVSRDRFQAGDIAQVDLDRLELQRVQFEADVQTAETNLRTAKIQLLTLMNDRTPVEQFDVTGPFEFPERILPLEEFRDIAVDARPDLKAAAQAVDKAQTDHKLAVANGSTDPTFGVDMGRNPPIPAYIGFSVTIPLRIFDKNQGEKAAHGIGHPPQRTAARGRPGAGVQRRGFGLCHGQRQSEPAAPVQGEIPATGGPGSRDDFLFLSAWRSVAAGFSECPERLPQCATELPEPDWFLHDRRQPVESGGGPRGDPMKHGVLVEAGCSRWRSVFFWPAVERRGRRTRRPRRRRRPKSSGNRMPTWSRWTIRSSFRWPRPARMWPRPS